MNTPPSLFSADWYWANNPELAWAFEAGLIEPFVHFTLYGKYEGRSPGPLFSPGEYLALNPDVAAAVANAETTAYDHFMMHGFGESRLPLRLLDEEFYLQHNPDVAAAVAAGATTAAQHFLLYGHQELRPISFLIDLGRYVEANSDLQPAVQNGGLSAMVHLLAHGIREGRDLGNGLRFADFMHDEQFTQALAIGDSHAALGRVEAVAPFMPEFSAPAGWTISADAVIPLDFTPRNGSKLIVPSEVQIPEGMQLPDTFHQPAPQPPNFPVDADTGTGDPADADTGTGDPDGGGRIIALHPDMTRATGSHGNDTFTATAGTLTQDHRLDGLAGLDILNVIGPNAPTWAHIKNIETLNIENENDDVYVDAGAAGFHSVLAQSGAAVAITGGKDVTVSGAGTGAKISGSELSSVSVKNVSGAVSITNCGGEAATLQQVTLSNVNGGTADPSKGTATLIGRAIEEVTIVDQRSNLDLSVETESVSLQVNINAAANNEGDAPVVIQIEAVDSTDQVIINALGSAIDVKINAQSASTIVLYGDAALSLSNVTSASLTLIDGSRATGPLTVDLSNASAAEMLVEGGLSIRGGRGDDTIILAPGVHGTPSTSSAKGYTLSGGQGNDTFDVSRVIAFNDAGSGSATSVVNADVAVITTITDFSRGDALNLGTAATNKSSFLSTAIDVAQATSLTAALELAADPVESVTWFHYMGDTYVMADGGNSDNFTRSDIIVKLAGNINLVGASVVDGTLTFA